jgi:hypothetical protein
MPRFFFHLRTAEDWIADETGSELPASEDAYLEACRAIGDTVLDLVGDGRDPTLAAFHVTDETGALHWIVPMLERVQGAIPPEAAADEEPPATSILLWCLEQATAVLRQELADLRANRTALRMEVDHLRRLQVDLSAYRR